MPIRCQITLLLDMCYMYPKTRSIFTRTLCDSDQKLKVMSFKEAIYHPVVFQVLGIIFSSQDNFQTNYMFLSHISGRLHWICMKPVLCWQKFLWYFIFWTCFHLGECFSPRISVSYPLSLNSDWAHSDRPLSNISRWRC